MRTERKGQESNRPETPSHVCRNMDNHTCCTGIQLITQKSEKKEGSRSARALEQGREHDKEEGKDRQSRGENDKEDKTAVASAGSLLRQLRSLSVSATMVLFHVVYLPYLYVCLVASTR